MSVHRLDGHKPARSIKSVAARAASVIERLESRTLLAAVPPTLLRDPSPAGLFVEAGGQTFFTESGTSLHVTNGTAGGTFFLKSFGKVGGMAGVGDAVYLTTDTGVWRSDGTPAGTIHLLPMYENVDGMARAGGYAQLGGDVYFYAAGRYVPGGLWKSDGTPGGTSLVAPVFAESLTAVGDTLYFIGPDTSGGKELWKSDGTEAGTVMVKDIHPTHGSMTFVGNDDAMAAVGEKLVFKAHDGTSSYYSLWSSDGTEAGTTKISSTRPNQNFTAIDGAVYFGAGNAGGTGELWKSAGTAAGTTLIKDLGTMSASQLLEVDGTLYFAGPDGYRSASLWKSDGTATGTVRVAGPAEGKPFASIFDLNDAAGTVVFTVSDPEVLSGAYSLWTSDGTTAGTVKVRDTFTGGMQGAPGNVGVAGSVALFTANDGVGAPELWALQTATPPPLPEARARGPYPYVVSEGGTLNLHGYTTAEPLPDRPLTYAWDLDNDGVFGETGAAAIRGDESGTDPTFNAAGLDGPSTHLVHFRISDSTGYSSADSAEVTVRDGPPTLNVTGGPAVLTEGNAYTLMLSASDGGPDTITQWTVHWGDGVSETLPGSTTSVTHDYPAGPGTYGITVKAQDDDGEYRVDHPAALDATFGSGGKVFSQVGTTDNQPKQLVVQPDGKILALSYIHLNSLYNDYKLLVTRYQPDGTLDATFGTGGRVIFDAAPYGEVATGLALQPDGRIVVSGALLRSLTPYDIGASLLLLRLLPDGSLDPSFGGPAAGGADGKPGWVTYQLGSYESLPHLEITADGDILAGGVSDGQGLLVRFNSDGSLDTDFGIGGKVLLGVGGLNEMALLPDGKILALPAVGDFLIIRVNPDGAFDPTFDGDGRATVGFDYGTPVANSFAVAPDGSILVAGRSPALPTSPQPGGYDAVVARLTASGTLDTSFADNGRLRTVPAGPFNSSEPLEGMALPIVRVLPEGRFLLAGSHELYMNRWQYLVDRYHADGTADTSFAPGGRFAVDLGGTGNSALLRDVAIQPDGAPVLYGSAGTGHNPIEALVRLGPPGLSVRVVDAGKPELSITAPATTSETATYTLDLSASDPDGDGITHWIINWGDDAVQVVNGNPSSVTHVYADGPRSVIIKASAIDRDRSISSVSANVSVTNVPPTITVTGGEPVAEGSPYTVQFSATDPGPDTITRWTVDWGDGKFSSLAANATSAQHVYTDDGTYTVVVSASDEDGTFAAAPVNASITNVAPTLDPLGDRLAAAAATFQLTFTARDVVPEIFSGTIDWGDGSEATPFAGSATTPLAVNVFAIDHAYAARGTYVVTINLSDGDGGTAQRTSSVQVGDVIVRVYEDKNGNGVRDSGDRARAGVSAFIDVDRDGALDAGEPTGTTDTFGDVLFDDLPATAHAARVIVPPNWHLSTPAAGFTEVTPGTASALATFALTQAATVAGALFDDANANGLREEGEGPLSLTVRARRVDTGTSVSVLADAAGVYRFSALLPGQYVIELATTSRVTTAPYGRRGHLVTLTGEQAEVTGLDIGSFAGTGGTISGTLYRDLNGNGTRDTGEPGAFNQIVYIDINDNGVRDFDELAALSSFSGGWSIPRLPAGTYRIRQVLPPGSADAADPAVSREVTVALGQTVTSIDLARPYERTYYVRRSGDSVLVYNGSEGGQYLVNSTSASSTALFTVSTGSADDWVIVDWTFGNPCPAGGLHIDGLAGGADTISVIGTTAADAITFAAAGEIALGGASFSHAGFERVTFDGKGGWDNVTVTGGPSVTLAHGQALQSLALGQGAAASLAAGGPPMLMRGLSLTADATLNVRDTGFLLDYTGASPMGSWNGSQYTGVIGMIASGYNFTAWDGPGVITTMADAKNGLTTVAVGEAAELFGLATGETSIWHGHIIDATTVIVKYTYAGDANLDGRIDAGDYGVIDNYVQIAGASGYAHGDFNYDGFIDAGDYGIIDNNIQAQGTPLVSFASAAGGAEPASEEPMTLGRMYAGSFDGIDDEEDEALVESAVEAAKRRDVVRPAKARSAFKMRG